MLHLLRKRFLDVLFPPRCLSCGEMTEEMGTLCAKCWSGISFLGGTKCCICGFPFEYKISENDLCGSCLAKTPSYDKAESLFIYNNNSRKLITRFKYSDRTHAAKPFANWLAAKGRGLFPDADIVIPVPLHRIRLLSRRYNQSALIANEFGKLTKIPVKNDFLLRVKNNPPQAALSKRKRLINTKGVFQLNKRYSKLITGKNILLIDDVITTGATVSECAKVLKKAGAAKVYVMSLAKTVEN